MSAWRYQLYDLRSGAPEGDLPYRDVGRALRRVNWLNLLEGELRFSLRPVRWSEVA